MTDGRSYPNEPLKNPEIAQRIADLLKKRGWTQGDLMRTAGISRSEVSRLTSAVRSPTCATIAKIASALGVSTDYLISGRVEGPAETLAPDVVEFVRKYWTKLTSSEKSLLRVTLGHLQQRVDDQERGM